jgi:hypothetical protein
VVNFNVLAIRSYEDRPGDTYLYPGLGEQDGQAFAAEPADGNNIKMLSVFDVSVRELGRGNALVGTSIGAAVYVTDCRVVLSGEVQKTGLTGAVVQTALGPVGALIGAAGLAVGVVKVAYKAQDSGRRNRPPPVRRRKGKVMVGHLRYEWIKRIVVSPAPVKSRRPLVALEYTDGETTKSLQLCLWRGVEPVPVVLAQDIVRRAASFRSRQNLGLAPEQQAILEQLIYADILHPAPKEWAWYNLPASQIITQGELPITFAVSDGSPWMLAETARFVSNLVT